MNPLQQLSGFGQSVWLDFIQRSLMSSGELKRLVDEEAVVGLTSNPAIFEKAIVGSHDYDAALKSMAGSGLDPKAAYEKLAIEDLRAAADVLMPVFRSSQGRDGYFSMEVAPDLANNTDGTVAEALRLWKALERENAMIKVPATEAGIPAIRTLIAKGVNVNITLLFAVDRYEAVVEAYLGGLEALAATGAQLGKVASVASFFVSRIDVAVDELLKKGNHPELLGKAAIANAKMAYLRYQMLFQGPRWEKLKSQGAQTQRILWASTGTKDPSYSDVYYIENLIGPDTVNTIPPATLKAFAAHGKARASLEEGMDQAEQDLESLARAGVHLQEVTDALTQDALKKFNEPFEKLLATVAKAMHG